MGAMCCGVMKLISIACNHSKESCRPNLKYLLALCLCIVVGYANAQSDTISKRINIDSLPTKIGCEREDLYNEIIAKREDPLRYDLAINALRRFKHYIDIGGIDKKVLAEFRKLIRKSLREEQHFEESDRIFYLYNYIFDNNLDLLKGDAKFYRATYYYQNENYYESIKYFYSAIEEYSKINDDINTVKSYISLGRIYMRFDARELSRDVDSVLTNKYYKKNSLPNYLKNRILLYKISYSIFELDYNKSLKILKSINPEKAFKKKPYLKKSYYKLFSEVYIERKVKDSALFYIDKAYSISYASNIFDTAQKYIYKALIYYRVKEFEKSFEYIKKAERSNNFKFITKNDQIKLYKLKYLLFKQLNNHSKSLAYYEVYVKEEALIKDINTVVLVSALKYKKNIERVKNEANTRETLYIEKKKLHIFYIIVLGSVLFTFIVLLVSVKHKKQKEQLITEHNKIKEIFVLRNTIIENISHEISTPITILNGYLRLINKNIMNHDVVLQYLSSAKRNATYINNTFNDFLTTLKLEKKPLNNTAKEGKIGNFLLENITAFGVIGHIKNIEIYYKSNIITKQKLAFDYDSLLQIFRNLISNALKYSDPNSKIHVEANIDNLFLRIIVKDQGTGISDEDQPKIFDRFFQSNYSNAQGGFGIGLFLVKTLVEELGGAIKLDSKLGVGSIFEVQIPLDIPNDKLYINEIGNEYKLMNPFFENLTYNKLLPNILIVDDSVEMVNYVRDVLVEKFNCSFAFNGKEALEKIKSSDFDLIISDLVMPEMDGLLLKKEVNNLKDKSNIPFVLMTSSSKEYIQYNQEMSELINDYIIKPFQENELIVRIDNLIERKIHIKELKEEGSIHNYRGFDSKFIQKVCGIIIENIHNSEFTVKELAEQCGYSNKQLTLIVKEKTGLSPVKLILEYRLLKSYDLIVDKSYSTMKEVIFAVGLNSRTYFNKAFENRFGIKPMELMSKSKK